MNNKQLTIILFFLLLVSPQANGEYNPQTLKFLDKTVTTIEHSYFDPQRIEPSKMLTGALTQMQRIIPEILVKQPDGGFTNVVVGLAEKKFRTGNISSMNDLKNVLSEILLFAIQNYHGETPPEEIEYAAIDGLLEVLDPHSNFMPPKLYKEFQVGTRGVFGGLGIVISVKDGQLTVVSPIDGTPASRAGIRAGDRILQIDDESTINMSLTDAVNKLRGDVGSKVTIITERQGTPPKKIALTRAIINIDSVKHKLLTEDGKRVGYLKVKSFQSNTDADVKKALKDFKPNGEKLDGLILDLRNNPGGLLNIAVDLANHFIKDGVIVSTIGPHDQIIEKDVADGIGTEENYPIIVLINEGSASASEIVAGALQANNRAVIMGSQSFGKGSVQTVFELGDAAALKITIAQYKPAGTLSIQLAGVSPDIKLTPVTVDKKYMNLVGDVLPSEGDLEQHLQGTTKDSIKNSYKAQISYLQPHEDKKELEEKSVREYSAEPDVEKDFAVTLARRLLAKATLGTRDELISKMAAPLVTAQAEQQTAIVSALKTLNIDWTGHKSSGEPKLSVAYRLRTGNEIIQKVKAGNKIEIVLSATNTGSAPYSRLIAVGQSDMPFLSNIEFPFGYLPPGATRSWSVPVELPDDVTRQNLTSEVTFEEENGKQPKPFALVVPTDEIPTPSFAFSLDIPKSMLGKDFSNNVRVPLTINISNVGKGASSPDTTATISNECGERLFIEKGRTKLGSIPPKTSRQAMFQFRMGADEKTNKKCEIKLIIADLKYDMILVKKIELLAKEGNLRPAVGVKYQPPVIEIGALPLSTDQTSLKIEGVIKDQSAVKDYFIFVGDKKITYVPNVGDKNTMLISTTVPLEPGNNQILIGGRDDEELLSRKFLAIERTSGERKSTKRARASMQMQNGE